VLGVGLIAVALSFLRSPSPVEVARLDAAIRQNFLQPERVLVTADGEEITYAVCNRFEGRTIAASVGCLWG